MEEISHLQLPDFLLSLVKHAKDLQMYDTVQYLNLTVGKAKNILSKNISQNVFLHDLCSKIISGDSKREEGTAWTKNN